MSGEIVNNDLINNEKKEEIKEEKEEREEIENDMSFTNKEEANNDEMEISMK